jgi:hypothetical protein
MDPVVREGVADCTLYTRVWQTFGRIAEGLVAPRLKFPPSMAEGDVEKRLMGPLPLTVPPTCTGWFKWCQESRPVPFVLSLFRP